MTIRLGIFFIFFGLLNLAFIPLLSLYGLRVCPVLSIPGFGFGCYYAATFVGVTNVINAVFLFLLISQSGLLPAFVHKKSNRLYVFAAAYFLGTLAAIVILQMMLKVNHLSPQSRGPEILILASLLLGVTQVYGINWALDPAGSASHSEDSKTGVESFSRRWLSHIARMMFPVFLLLLVLLHYLLRQSVSLNQGHTAPVVPNDDFIQQTSYVIVLLLGWFCATFAFHFASERDQVKKLQGHFDHLKNLDFKFRSAKSEAWGLWAAFIEQLNGFSQALGERTRLLKTFSRFVTAGVAEKALQQEINTTGGVKRELTVLMSDIRDFTAISGTVSPDEVVTLLNEYFSAMLDVFTKHQISVDKYIGDGILAYVDLETSNGDAEVENKLAVEAALAMIKRLEVLNEKFHQRGLPKIKIGVGIHRGPLVIGLIGSEAKLQHTIIGDTVNRASRLEGLCKELGVSIVISEQVHGSLDAGMQARFKPFAKQSVKGIAETMDVFGV